MSKELCLGARLTCIIPLGLPATGIPIGRARANAMFGFLVLIVPVKLDASFVVVAAQALDTCCWSFVASVPKFERSHSRRNTQSQT